MRHYAINQHLNQDTTTIDQHMNRDIITIDQDSNTIATDQDSGNLGDEMNGTINPSMS